MQAATVDDSTAKDAALGTLIPVVALLLAFQVVRVFLWRLLAPRCCPNVWVLLGGEVAACKKLDERVAGGPGVRWRQLRAAAADGEEGGNYAGDEEDGGAVLLGGGRREEGEGGSSNIDRRRIQMETF